MPGFRTSLRALATYPRHYPYEAVSVGVVKRPNYIWKHDFFLRIPVPVPDGTFERVPMVEVHRLSSGFKGDCKPGRRRDSFDRAEKTREYRKRKGDWGYHDGDYGHEDNPRWARGTKKRQAIEHGLAEYRMDITGDDFRQIAEDEARAHKAWHEYEHEHEEVETPVRTTRTTQEKKHMNAVDAFHASPRAIRRPQVAKHPFSRLHQVAERTEAVTLQAPNPQETDDDRYLLVVTPGMAAGQPARKLTAADL